MEPRRVEAPVCLPLLRVKSFFSRAKQGAFHFFMKDRIVLTFMPCPRLDQEPSNSLQLSTNMAKPYIRACCNAGGV